MCVIESMISSGQARVLARRRNTIRLFDEAGRAIVSKSRQPVALAVQERLIAVWRTAAPAPGDEPAYFICQRTRRGWHFDAEFGTIPEVWRDGPIIELHSLELLKETWGNGKGWRSETDAHQHDPREHGDRMGASWLSPTSPI